MAIPLKITYKLVSSSEIPRAYEIESASYPSSEAASLTQLEYRQRVAPDLFFGAFIDNSLIGFAVSTASRYTTLEHESMSDHHPDGKTICLHSVVVDSNYRRQGIARDLLNEYIKHLQQLKKFDKILLLSHIHLVKPLYGKAGFKDKGKSSVAHGPDPWYEMEMEL